MVFGLIKRRQTEAAKRKVQLQQDAADYQRGFEAGQELAKKIVEAVDAEFNVFADGMISVFVKRVAIEVILSDDPTAGSQAAIADFMEQLKDGNFEEIQAAIRGNLSDWEQVSHDMNIHSSYEELLKDRFDGLFLRLWERAIDKAYPVVIARKAEMGVETEDVEALELGQKILEEVRATKITIAPELSRELVELLDEIER